MSKKRVLVLGAGVSGLSVAWHLEQKKEYECIVLEKATRPGGWMGSKSEQGFLLEEGPHLFKTSRSADLLQVVDELGFSSSILPSSAEAHARYIWTDGAFQKMPRSPVSLLTSSFCRPLLSSLWKERNVPSYQGDETIWDFACRRFGKKVAERFFDPFVSGIYAGDIKKLSVASCFPVLKKWENEKGSIVKGAISSKSSKKNKSLCRAPLFSFEGGTSSFIDKWVSCFSSPIHCNEEILSLHREDGCWVAKSPCRVWQADSVVVTIPSFAAGSLLQRQAPKSAAILQSFAYESITVIHLGWKGNVLPFQAFGYLVPSTENMDLLGVLFDSSMFGRKDTLITLMVRGVGHTKEDLQKIAETVCSSHLMIFQKPIIRSILERNRAIPQYYLGHEEKKSELFSFLSQEAPSLFLTGSYVNGVSISDCIKQGKDLVGSCF